jgi:hypothetical protein
MDGDPTTGAHRTVGEDAYRWGEIDGVPIEFPMTVRAMNAATLSFAVPLEPARQLVPGPSFEVAEIAPGEAMLIVALVDYVENPWGDYDEVNLGLLAHPVSDSDRVGAFVYRMPVDQEFTMKAGNQVLGLPKTVEDLRFEYSAERVTVCLSTDGRPALTVSLPRATSGGPPEMTEATTYSYLDGAPTALPLSIELGTGVVDPAEVVLELGEGPLAEELRTLGLPRIPDLAVWGEGLQGVFARPRPV